MGIILVHFNRKLIGLTTSVRNIENLGTNDPNYAIWTVYAITRHSFCLSRLVLTDTSVSINDSATGTLILVLDMI